MYDNLLKKSSNNSIDYAISDSNLPFNAYINHCRDLIKENRVDLEPNNSHHIIEANAPFELLPTQNNQRHRIGVLLIHGLLDSPFSLKDIGLILQSQGIHCRAILLPGHGTKPTDLLSISYLEWIQAVKYGIESFRKEVDKLFLVGYSTGAALALSHALENPNVDGLVLLSPAIRIAAPVKIVVGWHTLVNQLGNTKTEWAHQEQERDYTKYQSIGFNSVTQVTKLTQHLYKQKGRQQLKMPVFMVMSKEDETISSRKAIHFFSELQDPNSHMLLYTGNEIVYPDKRITIRLSSYPDLHINHLSHIAVPIAPENIHYGRAGDYNKSSRPGSDEHFYGAYNRLEIDFYDALYNLGVIKGKRRELTFNPDFNYMTDQIYGFLDKIEP